MIPDYMVDGADGRSHPTPLGRPRLPFNCQLIFLAAATCCLSLLNLILRVAICPEPPGNSQYSVLVNGLRAEIAEMSMKIQGNAAHIGSVDLGDFHTHTKSQKSWQN